MIELELKAAKGIRNDVISLLRQKPAGFTSATAFQSGRLGALLESNALSNSVSVGLSATKGEMFCIELRVYQKPALELAKNLAKAIDSQIEVNEVDDSPVVIRRAQRGKMFLTDLKLNRFPEELRPLRKHKRPLFIGQGIGNLTTGGLGAVSVGGFVTLDNKLGALSVSHGLIGLGKKTGKIGNKVAQPHPQDTSFSELGHVFGELLFASSLQPEQDAHCDAAIVEVENPEQVLGNVIPSRKFDDHVANCLSKTGMPDGYFDMPISDSEDEDFLSRGNVEAGRVFKIGAGSGWSAGEFVGQGLLTTLYDQGVPYRFTGLVEVRGESEEKMFSCAGDSGALAFYQREKQLFALGLVIGQQSILTINRKTGKDGASAIYSLVCPLNSIKEHLAANGHISNWHDN